MGQNPVSKFLRLSAAERSLLVRAVFVLGATRLGLWLLPLRVVRRLLGATAQPASPIVTLTPAHIAWAVAVACRLIPRATCLPQALAAEALLVRSGYTAELRIGVAKTAQGERLVAHAWVESGGRVIVGELRELGRYTPLPPLPAQARRSRSGGRAA